MPTLDHQIRRSHRSTNFYHSKNFLYVKGFDSPFLLLFLSFSQDGGVNLKFQAPQIKKFKKVLIITKNSVSHINGG